MQAVSLPDMGTTSEEFFGISVNSTSPVEKRKRLLDVVADVGKAIDDYRKLAACKQLHTIAPTGTHFSSVHKDDFSSLYGSYLLKRESNGRQYYDKLMAAPDHGICPFCGTRNVATLDHFLSKRKHPQFSIAFENLVGCCSDCNLAKRESQPANASEVLYHPYYESFPEQEWLTATVVHETPVEVRFRVKPESVDFDRIEHQFNTLGLGKIYAFRACSELTTMYHFFEELLDSGGLDALKATLADIARSADRGKYEPWKPAFYKALSNDDWFCEGAFRKV